MWGAKYKDSTELETALQAALATWLLVTEIHFFHEFLEQEEKQQL